MLIGGRLIHDDAHPGHAALLRPQREWHCVGQRCEEINEIRAVIPQFSVLALRKDFIELEPREQTLDKLL